ncbi:type VII secretion protein EsaA [Listeria weihenstephanensis]|uniref:Type VII secretion system accessory factor EsaA n=1 Tax=Listeria weihenstephanensis TaxID=1006155 RepID=A0A841ZB64_9LIST|nr:type VII secretion protein EsaA [Listeria weihenstephanensis]MBC1501756.1 type VII secretion protein EsaA [Listeria weihenstephanensis]
MKKIKWSVLAFFVLALLLSAGTSYLALEQTSIKKETAGVTKKLSIAIVNQDEGITVDGKEFNFGKELTDSVVKQKDQEWQTPPNSRYAEMGLKSGIYDLMITIPAGFSKQTMSPLDPADTSGNTEKAKLIYQISKTGNKDAEAEAERVALEKLNELNGQIIDVYFTTILASLHSAQDSIKKLVDKEETYGSVYNDHVNSPLSNYTQQFKTVQDYTGTSKESFRGLQDTLKGFGTGLADGTKVNETYFQSLEKLAKNQETNAIVTKSFAEQMTKNDSAMSTGDVSEQLAMLKSSNDEIYKQFQKMEENRTLSVQVDSVQKYLDTVNEQVSMIDKEVTTKMGEGLHGNVENDLLNYISDQDSGGLRQITLDGLANGALHQRFNDEIWSVMQQLKNHDPSVFEKAMGAGVFDANKYLNVLKLAEKYARENNQEWKREPSVDMPRDQAVEDKLGDYITNEVNKIKNIDIVDTNYYRYPVSTEIQFEKSENQQTLFFKAPTDFYILEDMDAVKITSAEHPDDPIGTVRYDDTKKMWYIDMDKEFTGDEALNATLTIDLYMKKDTLDNIFIQKPIRIDLFKQETKEVPIPETPTPEVPVDPETPVDPEKPGTSPPKEEPEEPEEPTEGETTTEIVDTQLIGMDLQYMLAPADIENERQRLFEELGGPIKQIADDTAKYVAPYYRLAELFRSYYGIDINSDSLDGKNLAELATDNSFYTQFNKDRVAEIVAAITDSVTRFIQRDLLIFQQQVEESQTRIGVTKENANVLTERLNETTAQAVAMNASVAETLANVEAWRKASLDLLDKGGVVITNTGDEKSATLALGSDFQGLLSQSKSLADSSKTNLNSADNVYKTFDAIDKQAKNIQNSGLGIVTQAQRLATNMANKLGQDQEFSGNFSEVMAKSRIGEKQNEGLNSLLSNPVTKEKGTTIAAGDTFTPYLIVLVCFIVALFTGYVIAAQERKRKQEDDFEEEMALAYLNTPITLLTIGIGLLEGAIIGAISAYFLDLRNVMFVSWMGIIILVMLVFVMIATYLLRQLRMIGMFLLLVILAMYLFLTEAVGLKIDKDSILATVRSMSPLQYVENMLNGFASRTDDWLVLMYSLIGAAVVGIVVNLFVWHRSKQTEGNDEDE